MNTSSSSKIAVVAIGGNALIPDPENISVESERVAVRAAVKGIVTLINDGWRVVIVHGNGPQVGFNLRRAELAREELFDLPLDVCGTFTQGSIGYYFQRSLYNRLKDGATPRPAATIITQVEVAADDPAFAKPTKPIGMFLDKMEAARLQESGWDVIEDSGRGWRRVVPSPKPIRIIEMETIRLLVENDVIVIAGGGGGIPVALNKEGRLSGQRAVIDKDFTSAMLAEKLGAELLIICTSVERVAINFGQPNETWLEEMTLAQARQYMEEGHFAPGSMLPKMTAMTQFVARTGHTGLITDPFKITQALSGVSGTRILSE